MKIAATLLLLLAIYVSIVIASATAGQSSLATNIENHQCEQYQCSSLFESATSSELLALKDSYIKCVDSNCDEGSASSCLLECLTPSSLLETTFVQRVMNCFNRNCMISNQGFGISNPSSSSYSAAPTSNDCNQYQYLYCFDYIDDAMDYCDVYKCPLKCIQANILTQCIPCTYLIPNIC